MNRSRVPSTPKRGPGGISSPNRDAAADNADDPADALARVNRILCVERRSTLFVTAALAAIDANSGSISLANAGHEPPLAIRVDGRVEPLEASGPLLGAFAGASFQVEEHQVAPGETLVLYTDGITDTRDPTGAFYGEARLVALLQGLAGASADDVRRAVLADVRAFRGPADMYDDLTLLVAQRTPQAELREMRPRVASNAPSD